MDKSLIKGVVHIFLLFILFLAVIVGTGYFAFKNGQIKIPYQQGLSLSPTPTPTPDGTANWKTFRLENISFKYPGGWRPPETFDSNFGLAGRIESTESEHVIRVLTGLNKGRTPEENEKFIEDFSLVGQKLTLDGSIASLNTQEYEGTKAITIYVLSKNKDSAYSISITSKADDKNTENLFDQILSTFQFLE